ncbi:hypothetical protein [Persicobacter psychrovividus]|uniref:Cyclic nucleotide-binding domain-containing protein n=1 Tax=Persicobacter psychrovividus TaxID=387638 RepID=A0ABM7VKE7_9BACT|nr:hypothetical protein PEPS_36240 [Persicobacter psychrovividus]
MSLKTSQLLSYGFLLSISIILYEIQWVNELFYKGAVDNILLNLLLSLPLMWVGSKLFSLLQNRFNLAVTHGFLLVILGSFYYFLSSFESLPKLVDAVVYLPYTLFGPLFWLLHQMLIEQLSEIYSDHARLVKEGNPITLLKQLLASAMFLGLLFLDNTSSSWWLNSQTGGVLQLIIFVVALGLHLKITALSDFRQNLMRLDQDNTVSKLFRNKFFLSLVFLLAVTTCSFFVFHSFFWGAFLLRYPGEEEGLHNFYALVALVLPLQLLLEFYVRPLLNRRYGLSYSLEVSVVLLSLLSLATPLIGWQFGGSPEEPTHLLYFLFIFFTFFMMQLLMGGLIYPTIKIYMVAYPVAVRIDYVNKILRSGFVIGGGITYVYLIFLKDLVWFSGYRSGLLVISPFLLIWLFVKLVNARYKKALRDVMDQEQPERPNSLAKRVDAEQFLIAQLEQQPDAFLGNLLLDINHIKGEQLLLKWVREHYQGPEEGFILGQLRWRGLISALPFLKDRITTDRFSFSEFQQLALITTEDLERFKFKCEHLQFSFQMVDSQLPHERRKGAHLLSNASLEDQHRFFPKLFLDEDYLVKKAAIEASVAVEKEHVCRQLLQLLKWEGLHHSIANTVSLSKTNWMPLLKSFFRMPGQKEVIQIGIVRIYGALKSENAIDELLNLLEYPQPSVSSAALQQLVNYQRNLSGEKHLKIRREIFELVQVTLWNLQVREDVKQYQGDEGLLVALKQEIKDNYSDILKMLTLIFDSDSMALVRDNLFSPVYEQQSYAIELLDWLLDDEMKATVMPILGRYSPEEKIKQLRDFYLTYSLPYEQLLQTLVLRDYRYVNRWTKAVAMQLLKSYHSKQSHRIFVANLVNPDVLLAETAAQCLKQIDEGSFNRIALRFIANANFAGRALMGADEDANRPFLSQFDKIKLLQHTTFFKRVSGIDLRPMAATMIELTAQAGEVIWQRQSGEMSAFLVERGEISLKTVDQQLSLTAGELFLPYMLDQAEQTGVVSAITNSRLFYWTAESLNQHLMGNQALLLPLIYHAENRLNSAEALHV